MTGPDSDLALITEAAREAGALALTYAEQGVKVTTKSDGTPVTEADQAVDAFLRARLMAARPAYGWLSEESPDDGSRTRCDRVFVVDPIDGTRAFVRGTAWWTISIGVVSAGQAKTGVVYAPVLGELYSAERGRGATRNGLALQGSKREDLAGAAILGDPDRLKPPHWPVMTIVQRNSIALRIVQAAAGDFDAVIAFGTKRDWDIAAGLVIAEEAGLQVTDHQGSAIQLNSPETRCKSLIGAPSRLHRLILTKTQPIDR